jgi:hypothetical protein
MLDDFLQLKYQLFLNLVGWAKSKPTAMVHLSLGITLPLGSHIANHLSSPLILSDI